MNKTALITGATSGLGLSYAKYFASNGYNLIITGRREDIIQKNAENLRQEYRVDITVIIVELSCSEGITELLHKIKNRKISVLINNAGFGLKPTFVETNYEDIERLLFLQINCITYLTYHILKDMVIRNEGIIINISSDGAFAVMPHNVLYSCTKLFILNFTEGLHMELTNTNIRVQVVCPGFMNSHFHENAGMHVNKNKGGLFSFRNPDDVVIDAMKDFYKGIVVSVPDHVGKIIRLMVKFIPRKLFYKKVTKLTSSLSNKK